MNLAHYYEHSPQLAVDLVNSLGAVSGDDTLDTPEALAAFLASQAEPWTGPLPAPAASDLERVKALRRELRGVFEAVDAAQAATLLNSILAENGAVPRVVGHEGHIGLHFEPSEAALNQWLGVMTGIGLAMLVADEGLARLGVCASETCADVFVDTSRNRSRRHCTTTCGTRENVAAFRRRQRGQRDSDSAASA